MKKLKPGVTPGPFIERVFLDRTRIRDPEHYAFHIPALRGFSSLDLHPQVTFFVGENGSGKSTLMKILVGGLDRDGGSIARRGSLGYCPQEPILYERLTCDEHFQLFGRAYGLSGLIQACLRLHSRDAPDLGGVRNDQ
jgi:ABC-type multidrug transport system ATPase subunit